MVTDLVPVFFTGGLGDGSCGTEQEGIAIQTSDTLDKTKMQLLRDLLSVLSNTNSVVENTEILEKFIMYLDNVMQNKDG